MGHVEPRLAEGVAVEELWQEDHRRDIGVVRAHAPHREGDDRCVAVDGCEFADQSIQRVVHAAHRPAGVGRRGMRAQRMAGVDAVPQPLDRAVHLSGNRDEEIPIGEALAGKPAGGPRANVQRPVQGLAHLARALGRGPRKTVGPAGGRVETELLLVLRSELARTTGERHAGIVRPPTHDSAGVARSPQIARRACRTRRRESPCRPTKA